MRDPYSILGVDKSASAAEIKRAYRKLAKELHPDLNPDDKIVENRFKEVSAAYNLLGDEKTRGQFDRGEIDAEGNPLGPRFQYQDMRGGPGGAEGFSGFSGFSSRGGGGAGGGGDPFGDFSSFFSDLGGGRRRSAGKRNKDKTYKVTVGFLDAARGDKRRISLPDGKVLNVTIPAGIEDGQTIRLKGQGARGTAGFGSGDALIEISIEPHDYFTREGLDVFLELPIALHEAVLGGKVQVPTVHGTVSMNIPKGANTGRRMRLKEKGIAAAKGGKKGDQFVTLKVVLPENPDPELEKAMESWAEKHSYNPRKKMGLE